jgi:hypothetical protein
MALAPQPLIGEFLPLGLVGDEQVTSMEGDSSVPADPCSGPEARVSAAASPRLDGLPDFLIISPPKTGSTWLADNLRCHPDVFVPAVKEIRYFSSLCKWLDLDWYCSHFASAAGRCTGEASPSYAVLPVSRLRWIRALQPDVKLIFLMRDPIARAWSHAKHNFRYREANFAGSDVPFERVAEGQWYQNFCHEWPLAHGDYLGQLRRWLSVFPRDQLYVGFFEGIVRCPQRLLTEILAFLGLRPDVDFSQFRLTEKILPGLPGELPPSLRVGAERLIQARTQELEQFLHQHFHLSLPSEWAGAVNPRASGATGRESLDGQKSSDPDPVTGIPEVFRRDLDDDFIGRIVAQEEKLPFGPRLVSKEYRGHDILFFREQFYALDQALGPVGLENMADGELHPWLNQGRCFIGRTLADLKRQLNGRFLIGD